MRGLWTGGVLLLLVAATKVCAQAQETADDTISANVVASVIRDIGWAATIDQDSTGNPRIKTSVDRYNWIIVLRDCAAGANEDRRCPWFQFLVDTETSSPVPAELINRWNKEFRYARAALLQGSKIGCPDPGNCTARIDVDVLVKGTKGDPAKTFRAYFGIVRARADGFRTYLLKPAPIQVATPAPPPPPSPAPPPQPAPPPPMWNSVAASIWKVRGRVNVAIGYSGTRQTDQEARESAIQACENAGGPTCKATGAWSSGCVYITTGSARNRAGWASGDSIDAALNKCRGNGFRCKTPIGGCVGGAN
jgi:Putative bacterial sensory transduction regulator/Domain of unknown function (DUF4189)